MKFIRTAQAESAASIAARLRRTMEDSCAKPKEVRDMQRDLDRIIYQMGIWSEYACERIEPVGRAYVYNFDRQKRENR